MTEEETIADMLKTIEAFAIQLKSSIEKSDKKESVNLFYRLRRQNYYLYRKAKRHKLEHVVLGSKKISAQLGRIRKSLKIYPQDCLQFVGMIIELSKDKELIDEDYREKIAQLRSWGYEQERSPVIPIRYHSKEVTELLIENWDKTEKMAKASGEYVRYIFDDFLTEMVKVLNRATLPIYFKDLPSIVKILGDYSGFVFRRFKLFGKYLVDDKAWNLLIVSVKTYRKSGVFRLFDCLDSLHFLLQSKDTFVVVLNILNQFGSKNDWQHLYPPALQEVKTIDELRKILNYLEGICQNKNYWTVQGLLSMGYLCVHVTNAEITTSAAESKRDPFRNIAWDILTTAEKRSCDEIIKELRKIQIEIDKNSLIEFTPSASIISQKLKGLLFTLRGREFPGLVGIVFDYGYIYLSSVTDASTKSVGQGKKLSRTSLSPNRLYHPAIVANYSEKEFYNEVVLKGWTVQGLFYTKQSRYDPGCPTWVVNRLKQLSDVLSYHQYRNGAHIYRTIKLGTPRYLEKIFPVYEIDKELKTWRIVYTPIKKPTS